MLLCNASARLPSLAHTCSGMIHHHSSRAQHAFETPPHPRLPALATSAWWNAQFRSRVSGRRIPSLYPTCRVVTAFVRWLGDDDCGVPKSCASGNRQPLFERRSHSSSYNPVVGGSIECPVAVSPMHHPLVFGFTATVSIRGLQTTLIAEHPNLRSARTGLTGAAISTCKGHN